MDNCDLIGYATIDITLFFITIQDLTATGQVHPPFGGRLSPTHNDQTCPVVARFGRTVRSRLRLVIFGCPVVGFDWWAATHGSPISSLVGAIGYADEAFASAFEKGWVKFF